MEVQWAREIDWVRFEDTSGAIENKNAPYLPHDGGLEDSMPVSVTLCAGHGI